MRPRPAPADRSRAGRLDATGYRVSRRPLRTTPAARSGVGHPARADRSVPPVGYAVGVTPVAPGTRRVTATTNRYVPPSDPPLPQEVP
ncbi:hypothetical protein PSA01_45160 [Pseudonocardia saturnea]|uniref:Uncharacterized protein n=1 Tax=Pseudonocardia saturnea TaxID=33909 RepID=A0ABQ0S3J7_9PSEU|nr:hypothetical protein Pdca_15310 [Pseudonocardia autotrophica]GEC27487.1 hypothetical protein PSA01_45160 [Pseudonocardia saturnea]